MVIPSQKGPKMDVEGFIDKLKGFDALRDNDQITFRTLEPLRPLFADVWPEQLDASIRRELVKNGINKPYKHQVDAIIQSLKGFDVVLESPTASGKTLAFTAPMLHTLKRKRHDSHALMIYPMKALAFDQREQIRNICQPLGVESWPYDGDVDKSHKEALRKNPPDILLTNPEYLNMSFLGWRSKWNSFLKNLQFIVLDEMHEYRGFFGSNMALLLRRFFLYLKCIGVYPRVFLSTATCANPAEHAKNLIGRDVEVVSASKFRPRRHYIFVNPLIRDYKYRDILRLRVESAALTCLQEDLSVLIFCPTKKFLEDAYMNCVVKANEMELESGTISPFHADMKSGLRQEIQQKIRAGKVKVILTTNALELGLDIGSLDGVILAGFPPSVMSAWQQIGRAGRGWDRDAFVLFYAMNDPIDRFFSGNLDAFLTKPLDSLVIDPSNEALIQRHLEALKVETDGDLSLLDKEILGESFYESAKRDNRKLPSGFVPHSRLNIRGSIGRSFDLRYRQKVIGQISDMRRLREAYIGAIFTFLGNRYRVKAHEESAIILTDAEENFKTEPNFFTRLAYNEIYQSIIYSDFVLYYGSLDLITNFTGYKLIDERSGQEVNQSDNNEALFENDRHAFWINIGQQNLLADKGIGALEHLIRVGSMFIIPADRFDTNTYSKSGNDPTAFYYENYSGGIGVAKKLFEVWQSSLDKGIQIATGCSCRRGCQNCIEPAKSYNSGNSSIDKSSGVQLARALLREAENNPGQAFSH